MTLIGKVGTVLLLIDHEVQRFHALRHALVVVLHVDFLRGQHTRLDTRFREELDEGLILGQSLMAAIQSKETLCQHILVTRLLTFGNQILRLGQELGSQLALYVDKSLYERLVLLELLVFALRHGTRNNQGSTGIVDQHGVHLIDDGIVMRTLHEVGGVGSHVVTKVVETKLVVRTKGDVCHISLATSLAIGLMLIDAVYAESMEHIERSHPLRVTLGQIVVDCHHMHAITRQRIEEHRQGSHEGLTFTRCHFRNLTLMQNGTTKELHVVVNHVPLRLVASGHPVVVVDGFVAFDIHEIVAGSQFTVKIGSSDLDVLVIRKALGCTLHDGEGDGAHLFESLLKHLQYLFLQFVDLCKDGRTVLNLSFFNLCLQVGNLLAQVRRSTLHLLLNLQ